ncbi:MAG: amidohydrolase family protein [Halobacteriales archaeon]|nr:amidohydrolase family protein [Halobacteriales archaeon]
MSVDIVIRDGQVVTADGVREADVAVDGGTIAAVGPADELPEGEAVVDAAGQLVLPGVVDPHVHVDDPYSYDTYETASRAAALGGITTFIDFAWQPWVGEGSQFDAEGSLLEGVEHKRAKADDALVDYSLHLGFTREDESALEEVPAVIDAGIPSFKMLTAYAIGVGYGFMEAVFGAVADHDGVALVHTEDRQVCDYRTEKRKAAGRGAPEDYPGSRPDYAEAMAADSVCRLAMERGCRYYGVHTTSAKAADVLARYRAEHGPELVRAETCPHYTTLDDSIFEERGYLPMLAPPIRTPEDNDAIVEHLREGTLDTIGTDHTGFTVESKDVDAWWEATFGMNSLQTSLAVAHDELVTRRGLGYPRLVELMCTTPARLFGMPWKGTLEPGTDADLVLFDPNETYTITAADNESVADYTLYEGREVSGRVTGTYVRGERVVEDGELVGSAGHGEFVERERPDWSG